MILGFVIGALLMFCEVVVVHLWLHLVLASVLIDVAMHVCKSHLII